MFLVAYFRSSQDLWWLILGLVRVFSSFVVFSQGLWYLILGLVKICGSLFWVQSRFLVTYFGFRKVFVFWVPHSFFHLRIRILD